MEQTEVVLKPGDERGLFSGNKGVFTAEQARKTPPHMHRNWEIMLILGGEGYLEFETGTLPFTPGTIFCIPPRLAHRNIPEAHSYFNDYCIALSEYLLPGNEIVSYHDDADHTFLSLIQIYDRIYKRKEPNWLNILQGIETTLQHLLISWQPPHLSAELTALVQTMQDHLSDPAFQVSDAIRDIHMSPDYVRRQFRSAYGCTPVAYMNRLRIGQARKLLLTEDSSITELAAKCGYTDAKYFIRLFSRETGYSPKEYRMVYHNRLRTRAEGK